MNQDGWNESTQSDVLSRQRARHAVEVILSDDHNAERGLASLHAVTESVLDEAGVEGLMGLAVELSLKLAEALERIATDRGLAAVDLVDLFFTD